MKEIGIPLSIHTILLGGLAISSTIVPIVIIYYLGLHLKYPAR